MRTNIKNKRGISLIVLVLTIIVMIILAAAIILSISNSGIIGRSNEAKIKSDIKTMQEELQVLKANEALGEDDEITIDKLSSAKGYDGKFDIQDGELKFVRAGLSEEEIAIAEEMEIKPYATVLKDEYNGVTISDTGVLTVDATTFNSTGITDIKIPNNVTSLGDKAFRGCSELTSVSLPSSLTRIASMAFYDCSSLEYISIPDSVESFGSFIFSGCVALAEVNLPSNLTIMPEYIFDRCSSLKSIQVPETVTTFGDACFEFCSSLEEIVLPDGVLRLGNGLFIGCKSLSSVVIPPNVSSIGADAFTGCPISAITIPAGVTTSPGCAFRSCTSLKNITIEGEARFDADDVKEWFHVDGEFDISGITITGSGYISE